MSAQATTETPFILLKYCVWVREIPPLPNKCDTKRFNVAGIFRCNCTDFCIHKFPLCVCYSSKAPSDSPIGRIAGRSTVLSIWVVGTGVAGIVKSPHRFQYVISQIATGSVRTDRNGRHKQCPPHQPPGYSRSSHVSKALP